MTYSGGVANPGAAAGNDGEVGTINSTGAIAGAGAGMTQAEKAAALGTTMAIDVTKSYHGTRGVIEPARALSVRQYRREAGRFPSLRNTYLREAPDGPLCQ